MKALKLKTNSNYYSKDDLNFNVKRITKSNTKKEKVIENHIAANFDSSITILVSGNTQSGGDKKDICAFAPDIDFSKKKLR